FADSGGNADPSLVTVYARVKKLEDAVSVRDEILKTYAAARARQVDSRRLEDAKSNARYSFVRRLDNTETIAATLASFVRYSRSYDTLNNLFRVYASLTPADLQAVAKRYFTDNRLVLTTLSHEAIPEAMTKFPPLASIEPQKASEDSSALRLVMLTSPLPQLNVKLLFTVGSAHDPKGKEGLAALTAAMVTDAGSKSLRIDEIRKLLYPMAGSFEAQVDKEMTTLTGRIHRDNGKAFFDLALPMLLDPGFREEDFQRLKDAQKNALTEDLRSNNEEELGKERLQASVFAGTPYGHPVLGTVAGIESLTLDDVRAFWKAAYTRASLTVGVVGDAPEQLVARLKQELSNLPAGPALPDPQDIVGKRSKGLEIEILEKETRATAISFGLPIPVTRSHPDYAALMLARTWLGEHRSSVSHLYQRIRELRGLNYGDYAYIEAFPRGMFQFFPDPNIARRSQIFEVWIRPVLPANGPMALRIALYELGRLIEDGISREDFERTREYLAKNVFVMTARQNEQLGYALDSKWYGIPEYASFLRERLKTLTLEEVNAAIRRHLSADDLSVVIVTKDAKGLKEQLVSGAFSPIHYDAEKPKDLLDEDRRIGERKLGIRPEDVRITPIEEVFAR
ncbi:MAG TPA: insulinase family protein, partial [Thermoanaerobaculia bacterium]|nr:insulinase family protein [Thermoanaerobaculia bacterium]